MSKIKHDAIICTGCWQAIGVDGENNRNRIGAMCSHVYPTVVVVPEQQLKGAVEALGALADALDVLRGPFADHLYVFDARVTEALVKARTIVPRGQ